MNFSRKFRGNLHIFISKLFTLSVELEVNKRVSFINDESLSK